MSKLGNGAIVEKCEGGCEHYLDCITKWNKNSVPGMQNPQMTPDNKDCRLKDVFVIHELTGNITVPEMLDKWGLLDAKSNDVEVYIVKRKKA